MMLTIFIDSPITRKDTVNDTIHLIYTILKWEFYSGYQVEITASSILRLHNIEQFLYMVIHLLGVYWDFRSKVCV